MISFSIGNYIFLKKDIVGKGTEQFNQQKPTLTFHKIFNFWIEMVSCWGFLSSQLYVIKSLFLLCLYSGINMNILFPIMYLK